MHSHDWLLTPGNAKPSEDGAQTCSVRSAVIFQSQSSHQFHGGVEGSTLFFQKKDAIDVIPSSHLGDCQTQELAGELMSPTEQKGRPGGGGACCIVQRRLEASLPCSGRQVTAVQRRWPLAAWDAAALGGDVLALDRGDCRTMLWMD